MNKNFNDDFVTRLKCYGKNDLNICSMPSDKFHEKGKPYIECFDYFKENNYGFSESNKEQFIIEKTYVNENVTDVHELYILGLECLLKKCRPKVSIEDNKINNRNDNNFYYGIVSNLKQEANNLNIRLEKLRNSHDMNGYIATLKSLKEVLNLISNYNWKTVMSEKILEINLEKNEMTVEITIWQENCEGLKQNCKSWIVNTLYEGKDRGLVIDNNRKLQ